MKLNIQTHPIGCRVLFHDFDTEDVLIEARIIEWSPSGTRVKLDARETGYGVYWCIAENNDVIEVLA